MKCLIHAIRRHEAELAAFLRARTGDTSAAKDLLQDVFLRALSQGDQFCALQNPRAWLFRVARNALIDHQRRQHKTHPLTETTADTPPPEPDTVDLLTECLGRNLARLSPADREIIEFCDLAGQTVKAYAERHAISLPAAKSRLLRARRRLRRSLEAHCALRFDEQGRVCDFTAPDQTQPTPHQLP